MKVFGHTNKLRDIELSEVVLVVSSDEAKKVGKFLLRAAEKMEANPGYEHEHLSDEGSFEPLPDLVVYKG